MVQSILRPAMDPAPILLDLPSSSFRPCIYGVGAWTDHLHFAYDLVATLKPRLLVELGTDRGESYFAFCQAAAEHRTGTRCFAVDTWQGDQQAGGYDETTFDEVSNHNAANYQPFSILLRCSFDNALDHFASDSIDVLHMDGLHTESAVRHDVEHWLPKIRPGGILLMHDISVRVREFGVWKVWDELRATGRSFAFSSGPGLGVWQKPPANRLPYPIETLLDDADGPASAPIEAYYRNLASEMQQKIAQEWRDGTIRDDAARQTTIQVFHTHDGIHREEDSAVARVGHEVWKEVLIPLPSDAGAAPLRIDFVSPFTTIDLAAVELRRDEETLFAARDGRGFETIAVAGDAERHPHHVYLRIEITGLDPQLYLPRIDSTSGTGALTVRLRLRATRDIPMD